MTVPDLPRDLLRSIALRSLHAHGGSARQWQRLSLVCTDWRGFLQDHPAWVELSSTGSSEVSAAPDEDWLRRTVVPLSRIVFSPTQEFAGQLLFDEATLRSSVTCLRELESLRVPALLGGPAFNLTRFSRLRCLNLVHLNEGPALARALEKLPRSLRGLKLTSLDGMRMAVPLGMQLQGLTQVTALTLSSRWGYACRDYDQYLASLPPSLRSVSLEGASVFVPSFRIRRPLPPGATLRIVASHIGCRLGRCVEHQSAGGQLAPGFAGLHLEFESLTIADHLRRDVSAGAASPGVSDLPAHAARQRGWDGDGPTPTAAESLLALIQEAVGLEEVRIGLPLPARQSACGQPKPLRLSYQHNDVRHGVDGPLHRDVYASVAGLHDAMQAQAAARGLDLQLVDDDEGLVIRKWQADLVADDQLLNGSACSAVTA